MTSFVGKSQLSVADPRRLLKTILYCYFFCVCVCPIRLPSFCHFSIARRDGPMFSLLLCSFFFSLSLSSFLFMQHWSDHATSLSLTLCCSIQYYTSILLYMRSGKGGKARLSTNGAAVCLRSPCNKGGRNFLDIRSTISQKKWIFF